MIDLPRHLVPMASQTGGENMRAIIRAPGGWGLMLSAEGEHNLRGIPDDRVVGIDNGICSVANRAAREKGLEGFQDLTPPELIECSKSWDACLFEKIVARFGDRANFIVLPDIIAGGSGSLSRSLEWVSWGLDRCERVLIPVQDGMSACDVGPHLSPRVGIFVGGLDAWKERSTQDDWGPLSREAQCWLHVGRVNSARRIAICRDAHAHSFDGTSASRYRKTLRKLDGAARMLPLFRPGD